MITALAVALAVGYLGCLLWGLSMEHRIKQLEQDLVELNRWLRQTNKELGIHADLLRKHAGLLHHDIK